MNRSHFFLFSLKINNASNISIKALGDYKSAVARRLLDCVIFWGVYTKSVVWPQKEVRSQRKYFFSHSKMVLYWFKYSELDS